MAGGVNKVLLLGRLGHDPDVKQAGQTKVAAFRLATSSKVKGEEVTEWHRVIAYGALAERAEKWLKKGREVWIEGSLRTRQYEPKSRKNKGRKMSVTEVVAASMTFMDSRADAREPGEEG